MSNEILELVKTYKQSGDTVMDDVCRHYGITEEEYVVGVSGIGDTSALKNFGIEI